ncbi:Uncharacterised protein [Cronobacter sakazakii]|nr:hypothetical protein CSE899_03896 [Cronobacter sakazakii E899]STD14482.1 Uncharacterised protein [Cronobacter sakazakii]
MEYSFGAKFFILSQISVFVISVCALINGAL